MKITLSHNKKYVLFLNEDHHEYNTLLKFPGLIRVETYFACVADVSVSYNVVARFLSQYPKTKISTDVVELINTPFKLKNIPESFKYLTTPKDFQEIALRYLYTLGSAGILLDPGMGKSKVILDYIALKQFNKTIIVCPSALLFVWEDEILKHRKDLSYYVVQTTDWDKELEGISRNQVVIINYDKVVILKHRLKELELDYIHLDEFLIKDPSTSRTQAITSLAKDIPYKSGGSGTLVSNSPLDVFCPIRFLQPSLVGWNYANFFNTYAITTETVSKTNPDIKRKVVVAFRKKEEIRSILESCCIIMTKEQWLKLPTKNFHDIYVPMGESQKSTYYQLARNYYANIDGKDIVVDNPLVMLSKLYQISQGFVYINNEDTSEIKTELLANDTNKKSKPKKKNRETIFFQDQPKINALEKLLTEKLIYTRAIIWFNLEGEFTLIKKLLDKLEHQYISIKGGDKNIGEKVRTFNRNPAYRWLVCQSKSVNYGITVLGTKKEELEKENAEAFPDIDSSVFTEIFYSINFSLQVYLQQQDRIHRLGQDHVCDYYRIFVNNPVETKLRQAISDKLGLKEEMLIDVALKIIEESSSMNSISDL